MIADFNNSRFKQEICTSTLLLKPYTFKLLKLLDEIIGVNSQRGMTLNTFMKR